MANPPHLTWRVSLPLHPSVSLSPLPLTLSISFSVSPSLPSPSDCHSTFMTGLWCVPKTDGARQDGRCCPGNRMESTEERVRDLYFFLFLVGCSGYQGDGETMWRGQQGHKERLSVSLQLHSGRQHSKNKKLKLVLIKPLPVRRISHVLVFRVFVHQWFDTDPEI